MQASFPSREEDFSEDETSSRSSPLGESIDFSSASNSFFYP